MCYQLYNVPDHPPPPLHPHASIRAHTLSGYCLQGDSLCWTTHTQSVSPSPDVSCQRDFSPVTERNNWEGLFWFGFFFFLPLKAPVGCCIFISCCLRPLVLFVCQTVYGYCEVLLLWRCSVMLDFTFSSHFPRNPALTSNWLESFRLESL